jgi:hypothetical protein
MRRCYATDMTIANHPFPALPVATRDDRESAIRDVVWLLGQPHLGDYLDFQKTKVIREGECDLRVHAAEWSAANDIYAALEKSEAGLADTMRCKALPAKLRPLAAAIEAHAWFRTSFDDLPYSFELVELDKLIVSQLQIENGFSYSLAERLGPTADPAALFRFCLPLERPSPPFRIRRLGAHRYEFTSPSSDFREHRPQLLRGAQLDGIDLPGPAVAMLGISVGFGSNFLSAIRSNKRVLLQNGYHRAFALRSAGYSHAWCIVEEVTRKDELRLTANEDVADDPEFYFAARRPPLLKDFFDPRLAKQLRARRSECVVEVEINVRTSSSTDV